MPNGAYPNFAGFAEAAAALTTPKPAIDTRIAALAVHRGRRGHYSGRERAVEVVSLGDRRLPDRLPVLETDVADAINRALDAARAARSTPPSATVVDGGRPEP